MIEKRKTNPTINTINRFIDDTSRWNFGHGEAVCVPWIQVSEVQSNMYEN
jgi:hypothetical protein